MFQRDASCFYLYRVYIFIYEGVACVYERYLYVGHYVCDEECVAELGNRPGLPNTHGTRTLRSGKHSR